MFYYSDTFENKVRTFCANPGGVVSGKSYGVEVKFYFSQVKVKDNFETTIKNLYTIGDEAGITRGLIAGIGNGDCGGERYCGTW